jgi:hypothetical protein
VGVLKGADDHDIVGHENGRKAARGRYINMCIFLWRSSRCDCLFRILASQDLSRIMGVLSAYLDTKRRGDCLFLSLLAEAIR